MKNWKVYKENFTTCFKALYRICLVELEETTKVISLACLGSDTEPGNDNHSTMIFGEFQLGVKLNFIVWVLVCRGSGEIQWYIKLYTGNSVIYLTTLNSPQEVISIEK